MAEEACDLCGYTSILGAVEQCSIVPNDIVQAAGMPKSQTIRMCCNCRRELDIWFSAKVATTVYDIGMQGFRYRTHTEMVKEYQSVFNAFVDYRKRRGGSQRREEAIQLQIDELATSPTATKKEVPPPDPFLDAARQLAREHKHISTSFLQRRLGIGYPKAARIMEQLEGESAHGRT
jgi:hypothetical protein